MIARRLLSVGSFAAGAVLAAGLIAAVVVATPLRRFVG